MTATTTVGFLGAGGTMGAAMARNLLGAGFRVRAWNRSRDKVEPLTEDGATVVDDPADAADGADVLITMLPDADVVADTVGGALERLGGDAVWVQTSTVGIEGCQRLAGLAEQHEVAYVDAPVLGTKQPAESGDLVVLASGPDEQRERVQPIFDAAGSRIVWAGPAGAGSRLKLVTNAWLTAVVEGAAETLAFAEGIGVDPQQFLDAVGGGPLDMPYLGLKGKAMLERSFEPSFKLALAAKDARLVGAAAAGSGLDLPLLDVVRARLEAGAGEHGDEDLSAVYLVSAPER